MLCCVSPPQAPARRSSKAVMPQWRHRQGCIRREGTSEVAPEALRQAVAEAIGGSYCWLCVPLKLALAVRETVAGRWLGTLGGGGGVPMHPWAEGHKDPGLPQRGGL